MKISRFIFQLFGINTYIVWDTETKQCAIIDPGMSSQQECEAIKSFIQRKDLIVKHLINTHLHIDHVAGNKFIIDYAGVKPEAHPADAELGRRIGLQAEMFQLQFAPEGVEISVPLNDGDVVKLGRGVLNVLHVPGHSQGSIALYDAEDGWVISGDALFLQSIGRTDLPGGSFAQLKESIKTKLFALPDSTVVYPGHGNPTTIGHEKKFNYFLKD